jgi:hypothetical protein
MIARTATVPLASLPLLLVLGAGPAGAPQAAGSAPAAREASKVRPATPNDMELRPGLMQLVTDEGSGGRYWVFTYSVINRTGKPQRFSPRFDLLMGDGTILEGGKGVSVEVASRLHKACASAQALDQYQIMGDVMDGEANARDGFVVWKAEGDAKQFTLFVSGMSAAFDQVKDPDGKTKIVRRTWCREFSVPGAPDPRVAAEARFDTVHDHWVMR